MLIGEARLPYIHCWPLHTWAFAGLPPEGTAVRAASQTHKKLLQLPKATPDKESLNDSETLG